MAIGGMAAFIFGIILWIAGLLGNPQLILVKDHYWIAILVIAVPLLFSGIYTASIGFNVGNESSRRSRRKFLFRIKQVAKICPYHIAVLVLSLSNIMLSGVLLFVNLTAPPTLLGSLFILFGYCSYFSLAILPKYCGSLIEQWALEDGVG